MSFLRIPNILKSEIPKKIRMEFAFTRPTAVLADQAGTPQILILKIRDGTTNSRIELVRIILTQLTGNTNTDT